MRSFAYVFAVLVAIAASAFFSKADDNPDTLPDHVRVTAWGDLRMQGARLWDTEARFPQDQGGGVMARRTVRSVPGTDARVEHGRTVAFYKSGQISYERWSYMGVSHGVTREWYENGQPKMEGTYIEGAAHGLYRRWDPDGRLRKEDNLFGGSYHGLTREWWPRKWTTEDKPWKTITWWQGKRQGQYTEHYPNGNLTAQGKYRDDKLHGEWTYWHENGQKKEEGKYDQDQKVGEWSYWDENGKLLRTTDHGEPKKD